jgi:dihydrofolate reductase
MRRVRFSAAVSLDGYIAGPKGEHDWIVMDPEIDFGAMMAGFDTVMMGRKSYEAAAGMGGGAMPGMQGIVVSRTLAAVKGKSTTLTADPEATLAEVRAKPGKDIWLFGGGELLRSGLEQGWVDALELAVIPVLLGGGIPLFPPPAPRVVLRLVAERRLAATGTVMLEYVPAAR